MNPASIKSKIEKALEPFLFEVINTKNMNNIKSSVFSIFKKEICFADNLNFKVEMNPDDTKTIIFVPENTYTRQIFKKIGL